MRRLLCIVRAFVPNVLSYALWQLTNETGVGISEAANILSSTGGDGAVRSSRKTIDFCSLFPEMGWKFGALEFRTSLGRHASTPTYAHAH